MKRKGAASSFLVLLVFGLFAVTSLLLVMIGANVYKSTVRQTDLNGEMRSSLNYVVNKVRANDVKDGVSVEKIDGYDVIVLKRSYDGEPYYTYLYCDAGILKELFVDASYGFHPDEGDEVVAVHGFSAAQAFAGTITVTVTGEDGRTMSAAVSPRSAQKE